MASRGDRMLTGTPWMEMRAFVRGIQPREDVHERALARSVLAQQGMHFAAAELEVHMLVGHESREVLDDAPHLDRECGLVSGDRGRELRLRHGQASAGSATGFMPERQSSPGATWPPGSDVNGC